jgi:hypothetical protein
MLLNFIAAIVNQWLGQVGVRERSTGVPHEFVEMSKRSDKN